MLLIKKTSHLLTRLPLVIIVILVVSLTPYFCMKHSAEILLSGKVNLETYYSDENIYRKIGRWSTQALVFGFLGMSLVLYDLNSYFSKEKPKKETRKKKGPFL